MVNWCHLVENWIRIVVRLSVIDMGGPKGFRCFLFFGFQDYCKDYGGFGVKIKRENRESKVVFFKTEKTENPSSREHVWLSKFLLFKRIFPPSL
jgi:hypothetical protein